VIVQASGRGRSFLPVSMEVSILATSIEIGKPIWSLGLVVKGHPGFDRGQRTDHFLPDLPYCRGPGP